MRVALVTGPDPGHLVPVAGAAVQLRDAGHDVVVVTGDRWATPLARDGLAFLPLPMIAAEPGDGDLGYRLHHRPVQMAPPLVAALRGLGLDLLVADTLTRVGGVAAAMLDLPWAELIPHPLPDPSVALPPFGTGWEPRPRRDRRFAARHAASRALGERQRQAALATAGLPDAPPVRRLVATLPALEPPRPDWPPGATLVVPPTWEPAGTDLPLPPGDAPLVLAVGTTASHREGVDLLAATLGASDGRWRVASPRFGAPPPGLPTWAGAGPGRLAPLLEAANVTVSPGGHGMVVAALRAGVPLVLVPGPGDQKETAARTARLGAAVRLDRPRKRLLRKAIGDLVDPRRGALATEAARRAGDVTGVPTAAEILATCAG